MDIEIQKLLLKPIWQMTGEEFLKLNEYTLQTVVEKMEVHVQQVIQPKEKKIAWGVKELSKAMHCSTATIYNYLRENVLEEAIFSRSGKQTGYDVEKAIELVNTYRLALKQLNRRYVPGSYGKNWENPTEES